MREFAALLTHGRFGASPIQYAVIVVLTAVVVIGAYAHP
jgi:Flp pilus assembly pilin Flp